VQRPDKRAGRSELTVELTGLVQSPRIEGRERVQSRSLLIERSDAVEIGLDDRLAGRSAAVALVDALDGRLDGREGGCGRERSPKN
jgi:hypothetical protein